MEVYRHLGLPPLPTTGVTCTRDDGVLPSNSATRDPEGWRWERVWRWWSNLVKTWKWIIFETHHEWDQEKSLTGFNRCSFRFLYIKKCHVIFPPANMKNVEKCRRFWSHERQRAVQAPLGTSQGPGMWLAQWIPGYPAPLINCKLNR